jgi:hypothetical protein
LKPAKELAEKTLSEVFVLMLLWSKFTGDSLLAYGADKHVDMGKQYLLEPEDIDEEHLYIDTELVADVPTDKLQRANTASILVGTGIYPKEYAMEDMGITDPQKATRQIYYEKWTDHLFELNKQKMVMELQQMFAQQQAQQQMAMQNEQAQQQSQMQAQQLAQMGQTGPQESSQPGGQGFNAAMDGMPPAAAAPGQTREFFQGGAPSETDMNATPGGMV